MAEYTDYFEEATKQMRSYGRKILRRCELCGEVIPWGYVHYRGVMMCQECFEKISTTSKD